MKQNEITVKKHRNGCYLLQLWGEEGNLKAERLLTQSDLFEILNEFGIIKEVS